MVKFEQERSGKMEGRGHRGEGKGRVSKAESDPVLAAYTESPWVRLECVRCDD